MARRRENIYTRTLKDGSVRYDVMLSYKDAETGKRKQQMRTFDTLAAAKAALAENQHGHATGQAVMPTTMSVADLLQDWLSHRQPFVRDSTLEVYNRNVTLHIAPYLGTLRLTDLTARRIEQHYARLRTEGLGPYAMRTTHLCLRQAIKYARRHRLIPTDPTEFVSVPRPKQREMQTWSDDEIARFLQAARDSYYGPIWELAVKTGLRRGELLGLRWEDIDEEQGLITLNGQLANVAGRLQRHPTKSGRSRRIAIGPDVVRALRKHRMQQAQWRLKCGLGWQENGLVFTTRHGTNICVPGCQHDFQHTIARAGVRPIRIHDLRHTHASWLLRHGRGIKQVSERLGHAQSSMTLNIYAHVLPDEHRATAQLIDREMAGL
jgi:integrase